MEKKSTEELQNILGNTSPDSIEAFLQEHSDNMIDEEKPFAKYLHQIISRNGLTQQEVFIQADFPERFGYKLLSEEKRTKQRDVILRLCYAAEFTLEETQRALRIYEMPQLYSKIPRDVILMVCFNERPGSVIDVNAFLKKHQMEPLRTSGIQE